MTTVTTSTAATTMPHSASQAPAPSSSSSAQASSDTGSSSSSPPASSSSLPRPLKKDPTRAWSEHPPSWAQTPGDALRQMILEVYKEEGVILDRLRVGKQKCHTFGRNADLCTHTLDHSSISRQHAAIVHSTQGPQLVDLFSSQGTQCNKHKLSPGEPVPLYDDDVIEFGGSSRKFKVKGRGVKRGSNSNSTSNSNSKAGITTQQTDEHRESEANAAAAVGEKRSRVVSSSSTLPSSNGYGNDAKRSKKDKIRASHLLIKHVHSRRPSSHRQPVITRTEDEAREILQSLQAQLKQHINTPSLPTLFASLAQEHSDCSSYKHGGDLGTFTADKMQPAFSEAAFALQVGDMSDIISTQSGFHLILRTE